MGMLCRKIEHPNYDSNDPNHMTQSYDYDFSLLKMKDGFDLPSIIFAAPACLPTASVPAGANVRNQMKFVF